MLAALQKNFPNQMTSISVFIEESDECSRTVTLTNDEWLIVSQAMEAFSETYRTRQSQIIATYVTRKQMGEAETEADKMNSLLQVLDKIQARLV